MPSMHLPDLRLVINKRFIGICMCLAVSIHAFAQQRGNARPQACDQYDHIAIPASDLPTDADRKQLASCKSEDLYFGFGAAADADTARKCAYIEREKGLDNWHQPFGGAGMLAMIYANGKGASRNFDLALRFVCEVDGAEGENQGRFEHLLKLQSEHWTGSNFNLCDDATSGFMEGWCADLQEQLDHVKRQQRLNRLTAEWTPREKSAFIELQNSAYKYFKASAENEVDLSGTGRAAFEIEAEASLKEKFIQVLEQFEKGNLPKFSAEEFASADRELNAVYHKVQAQPHDPGHGTVTADGIKKAQRAWIQYREAWVKFGQQKYPAVPPESWKNWLTRERTKMLLDLCQNCK